ncbi:hypothetical protein ACDP63_12860 [Paracoccus sp. P2]|uniref:Uncharacterized protein n=1 Tax=Paracoccus pantotrophus TaxID=82367 RepID=A0A7H9BZU3_PARPN|nr:hypothetical protein [Paracoccus pantotrophus]MDF3852691.1 hypothetical protein [Paracoccus pantotrophus]QLH16305.1 hypothetical protein HYQ43_19695 [Paracoccus pantotrophus]RNI19387.1 hypothetical protein EB844_05020 [Paracoccus pantotrophus]WGR64335.1 hypothetical protein E3U24_03065 [Paracoccus pantotrophus]
MTLPLRQVSGPSDGLDEVRAAMGEAIERLSRLEDVMCEMIRAGLAPTVGGGQGLIATGPPQDIAEAEVSAAQAAILANTPRTAESQTSAGPQDGTGTAEAAAVPGYISRRMLVELAVGLGETPLHAHPSAKRGLRLVGSARKGRPVPLYLRLDRHLRLPLDCGSNSLEIERRLGGRWHRTGLRAIKDGMGGIQIDIAMLEQLAGPFSPELRRILTLDPRPAPNRDGSPRPQPG